MNQPKYGLPQDLEETGLYLHPLDLMLKWNLDYETTAKEVGTDTSTLQRYSYPEYASTKRRPYRNKTVLRVAAVLDKLWEREGCPHQKGEVNV